MQNITLTIIWIFCSSIPPSWRQAQIEAAVLYFDDDMPLESRSAFP